MTSTPEQKPLLIAGSEGPVYTQADDGPPSDFWLPRQALAAKAEFACAVISGTRASANPESRDFRVRCGASPRNDGVEMTEAIPRPDAHGVRSASAWSRVPRRPWGATRRLHRNRPWSPSF